MSEKPVQLFMLTFAGRDHRVEVLEGACGRKIGWYVDDAGPDPDPSTGLGAVSLRFTALGRPRRVTLYAGEDGGALAAVGIGGIDLDPEPGSAAAAYEHKVRGRTSRRSRGRTCRTSPGRTSPTGRRRPG